MKKRMILLFMSLFALSSAVFGNAWAGEIRYVNAPIYSYGTRDCDLRQAPVKGPANSQAAVDEQEFVSHSYNGWRNASGTEAN